MAGKKLGRVYAPRSCTHISASRALSRWRAATRLTERAGGTGLPSFYFIVPWVGISRVLQFCLRHATPPNFGL